MTFQISNLDDLRRFSEQFVSLLRGGELFLLEGTLGAGKTTFVRAVSEAMGTKDNVCSPTFSLIQRYKSNKSLSIVHMDLYRLESDRELDFLDIEELLESDNIKFIEWGTKFSDYFEQSYILIRLQAPDLDNSSEKESDLELGEERTISFSIHNVQKEKTSLSVLFESLEDCLKRFKI
ncbi:tRNA (adenosine(37)-N6)-threonylcarbamoyltransferase complex ATPase subunit type 1 TsaE [bacterium]|jgi:tRNA threonylcarbamoyladenosine biosynthesis protein TsaE|nr:tRNA (adenosine(37)-N6)-threonylcarbamoyltransferase complex ATPase subunit type 1 TsaE [bacterium]